jgi:copper transport protein
MLRLPAALLAFACVALLSLAAAAPAHAHAQLLSSRPSANAVLRHAPEALTLTFNEPVGPLVMSLVAPDGSATDLTGATSSGETLFISLPGALGTGTHVLSWRVVSADAHPVAGALMFSVGTATGAVELASPSRATTLLLWISKALLFSALFVGIGGAVFALAAPPPTRARQIAIAAGLVGLIVAPLSLGLHGVDALGLDPDALVSAVPWATAVATSYGVTILMLAGGFGLALLAYWRPVLRWLAWPAWLLAALSLALSGHAGAAAPQWLTRSAVTLHIGGILFWIGALIPLWYWLRERSPAADQVLARFSRFIPYPVAAILASGITLAVIQLGAPSVAWLTPYGYLLAAKLGLVLALFGLAFWNRYRLTASILAGELIPRLHLRRFILVELVLVLAILALAAGWRFTPPPRALTEAAAAQAALAIPTYAHAMDDAVMADIVVTPGRAGPVTIDISIIDTAGVPLEPASVDVTLAAPALGIEPFKAVANLRDGLWRVEGQVIPLSGRWEITLDIRLSRFALSRIATELDIQP